MIGKLIAGMLVLAACSQNKEHTDLDDSRITLDTGSALIIQSADKFPNIQHKCVKSTGTWSTTDRMVIIVYNDWLCPGANREQLMVVINGNLARFLNAE